MANRAPKTLRPEDAVSHYRIVSALGAGGMGEVYLAQDQRLERNVALKILPPDLVRSQERVRRFVLEAKSASSLSHPNIVTIYEIGQDAVRSPGEPPSDPVHFISMELVSGKTLSALIHEDKTDLRALLGFLAQAAEGLAKAHTAGIVHRDLKPGNIMVSADGFAKVLDFGLAKLTEKRDTGPHASNAPTQLPDATGEGFVVGTVGYMSPEQVNGKTVDHRSDIFSFGCILYEAVTRVRPFAAETSVETMHKILNEKPAPVEELNPKAPAEVRRLIRRCLAKNPEQRFQSMKDLALELREIVDEFDALSASASSGGPISGGAAAAAAAAAKRSLPLPVIVALAVVGLGGVALGWWVLQRGKTATTNQPFQNMRMSTLTSRGDVYDCALSNDGRYLAYIAGAAGQATLRVRQVATGSDVEVLPAGGQVIRTPSFSPDGNYLFYRFLKLVGQGYSSLNQVPSLGGTPQERAFDVDSRVSFSPDGKHAAFWRSAPQQHETRLVDLDLDTGKDRILASVRPPENCAGGPAWSPDGREIAAALWIRAGTLPSVIALFEAATGRRQDMATLERTQFNEITWLRDGSGLVISGYDFRNTISLQLWLMRYPGKVLERVTNDFSDYASVSASAGDEAIGAIRATRLQNIWIAHALGGEARPLTKVMNPANSTFSSTVADSGMLAYVAPFGQGVQIWGISASGGEPRALTSGTALSINPHGAAGSIYFDRIDPSGVHIWHVGADGGDLRQLTTGKGGEQVRNLSMDGRFLAYGQHDSLGTLWLMSTADNRSSVFASNVAGDAGFSADGKRLLLGRRELDSKGLMREVWVAHSVPDGAPIENLRLPEEATAMGWSAAFDGMLFMNSTEGYRNLHGMRFKDSAPATLTRFEDGRIMSYSVSPDGRKLAIVRKLGNDQNVWVTEADGSRPMQVTRFTAQEVPEVSWLPDSRRLLLGIGTASSDAVLIRSFR